MSHDIYFGRPSLHYMNKGDWKGRQIVSAEWVKESTQPHVKAFFAGSEYGYQWWGGGKRN